MQAVKFENMSNEEYHAKTDVISRSAIMDYIHSPKRYWANYLNPNRPEKKTTPAMEFGEMFHCFILEPERFTEQYSVIPTLTFPPKVGLLRDLGRAEYDRQKAERSAIEEMNKKIIEEWNASNLNKKPVDNEDYATLIAMKEALIANEQAWHLITDGKYEQSYFWTDPESGMDVKARPDILHGSMVVDLKTCRSAAPRDFQRAMVDGGYHIQAGMIIDAVKAVDKREIISAVNIAVEKEYPYNIGIYIIDDAAIAYGRDKYKSVLQQMKNSKETQSYNDYEPQTIGLPAWYE